MLPSDNKGGGLTLLLLVYILCIEPKSKDVSLNMQGVFSFVRYDRKEIFVKGTGAVGVRILKKKY